MALLHIAPKFNPQLRQDSLRERIRSGSCEGMLLVRHVQCVADPNCSDKHLPTEPIMLTSEALDKIRSRILAAYPFLFLQTFEEQRWEAELTSLAAEIDREFVVWSATNGALPPSDKSGDSETDPCLFLKSIANYPPNQLFYVKDFHPFFADRQVLRLLRDLAPVLAEQRKTLMFVGPVNEIPLELQKEANRIALPLPSLAELRTELTAVRQQHNSEPGTELDISVEEEERLLQAVLGLTAREAHNALTLALMGRTKLDEEVFTLLVAEKKQMIEGSDLLEFFDLEEGVKDIGGLDGLKKWITRRRTAFSETAREQGVPMPKGVLLLGVQGCGKSLTARATARH